MTLTAGPGRLLTTVGYVLAALGIAVAIAGELPGRLRHVWQGRIDLVAIGMILFFVGFLIVIRARGAAKPRP